MIRVLLPTSLVASFDKTLLAWVRETEDSWLRFYLDTFVHYYADPDTMVEYFDAVFSEVDWEWRNKAQSPMSNLINAIMEDYLAFCNRVSPYLQFVHDTPIGTVPDLVSVEYHPAGILLSVTLREVPNGN